MTPIKGKTATGKEFEAVIRTIGNEHDWLVEFPKAHAESHGLFDTPELAEAALRTFLEDIGAVIEEEG